MNNPYDLNYIRQIIPAAPGYTVVVAETAREVVRFPVVMWALVPGGIEAVWIDGGNLYVETELDEDGIKTTYVMGPDDGPIGDDQFYRPAGVPREPAEG